MHKVFKNKAQRCSTPLIVLFFLIFLGELYLFFLKKQNVQLEIFAWKIWLFKLFLRGQSLIFQNWQGVLYEKSSPNLTEEIKISNSTLKVQAVWMY